MTRYRYKFTHADNTTFNGFKWKPGEWYETSGEGELCSDGWLHCYSDPLLAVLHNPIHGGYTSSDDKLWLVEVSGETLDDYGMKEGWTRMRLIEDIEKPQVTTDQRIAYGIMCALSVYDDTTWRQWAHDWLSGADRTHETARAAYAAASTATNATYAAADTATNATRAATDAAAGAAYAAADAAANAAYVAYAATYATYAAVNTGKCINLSHLATRALLY